MTEKVFINTLIPEELMKRVKDFQFDNRLDSRAEAVRMLLEWALNNYRDEGK